MTRTRNPSRVPVPIIAEKDSNWVLPAQKLEVEIQYFILQPLSAARPLLRVLFGDFFMPGSAARSGVDAPQLTVPAAQRCQVMLQARPLRWQRQGQRSGTAAKPAWGAGYKGWLQAEFCGTVAGQVLAAETIAGNTG